MTALSLSKRKWFELLVLLALNLVLGFIWRDGAFLVLFSLGYIWNWVASQDQDLLFSATRQYRFSILKLILNLQALCLKPVGQRAWYWQLPLKLLPAGLFWAGVIYLHDSEMPWWAVFLGSLMMELVLLTSRPRDKRDEKL